ncbi:hypothetical protein [Brevundimonas sp.]|uniref:hypothetical protein n=1 Tax=Brevundimonas sp. TaxID=1871086 RepID=UPI0028AA0E60|nr:hypothetical protein [Brevundimonas sp.]
MKILTFATIILGAALCGGCETHGDSPPHGWHSRTTEALLEIGAVNEETVAYALDQEALRVSKESVEASRGLILPAWFQAFFGLASAALLYATLHFTRAAASQARQSLNLQRLSTFADIRPYVSIERFKISSDSSGNWTCKADVINRGKSTALDVEIYTQVVVYQGACSDARWSMTTTVPKHRGMMQRDRRMRPHLPISSSNAALAMTKNHAAQCMIKVAYRDAFGGRYECRACVHYHENQFKTVHPCQEGNDEVILAKPLFAR